MTTADKLNKILSTKQDIKNAIEEKGQAVGDIPFANYADKIRDIESGGDTNITDGIIWTELHSNGEGKSADHYSSSGKVKDAEFSYTYNRASSTGLEHVNFKSLIDTIGYEAFFNCRRLSITSLPNEVQFIEGHAFRTCTSLETLNMPGVKEIGSSAFSNCSSLESITIGSPGNPVSSISSFAFSSCWNLDVMDVYVEDADAGISGAPWGAPSAQVNFLQA